MLKKLAKRGLQARYEQFGGIVASEEPPFLAHVDRDFMKKLGYESSSLWQGDEDDNMQLSAPLEVHFSITNRCSAGCSHCYTGATSNASGELSYEKICKTIDKLAEMGVFHIALGGGEALEREDLFDVAAYARSKGIVPNLTTSGYLITKENIDRFSVFGQVNVSIDTVNESGDLLRKGAIKRRFEALELLQKSGVRCGINTVVTRDTLEDLPELIKTVKRLKIREIELLRLKPAGRAADQLYYDNRLTDEQNRQFLPLLKKLFKKYRVHLKIDCSFVPMVVWHNPNKKLLEQLSLYGCEAGAVLLGISPKGEVSGCSFLSANESIENFPESLKNSEHLNECRNWTNSAPEPCVNCEYLKLCRGGCRAVSLYTDNNFSAPDPECPRVIEYQKGLN